ATHLAISVPPSTTPANAIITPPIQVTALDAGNNVATGLSGSVTMAIPSGSNPGGGTLSGTKTVAAVGGLATFSALSINHPVSGVATLSTLSVNKAGTGYTLTAGATGLTTATSSTFNVSAGGATHLAFAVQPSNAVAGAAITPAVQLTAQDAQGNTDPTFTGNILVALGANPGGGTLSGTTTVGAVNGVAAFSTLSINKTGIGYTLAASATGITGATSTTFNI